MQKKPPAPGYANLSREAVNAIKRKFDVVAGEKGQLDEEKIIKLFDELGLHFHPPFLSLVSLFWSVFARHVDQ